MATANVAIKMSQSEGGFNLPDPPQRQPDEMTSYDQLHKSGSSHYLALHLGNPGTTLVEAERWIVPYPYFDKSSARRPDLLIAFDVNPAIYEANNGYIISEQGKPPDFVMEIASPSAGRIDATDKRRDYAALGIPEYWRFDETGEYHGARLAGDRLVDGEYRPVAISELAGGVLQGYSAALNLNLRWVSGRLGWHDPATGKHILTYRDQRERADSEREARLQAEARVRELEEQLRRQGS